MNSLVLKVEAAIELDDDLGWGVNSLYPRIDKTEYHCPEYIQGQSLCFQSLPTEILLKIVTCLDPSLDIRALRYIRKVFMGTNIEFLGDVAERVLQERRTQLLDTSFWNCVCKVEGHDHGLDKFVGRQYVCEKENTEGDKWVFKKSQLPPAANGYYFSSVGFSDDMFYQHDRLNIDVGIERHIAEDEIASRLNGVSDIHVYRKGKLWKTNPGLKGYGGVCQSIHWG